MNMLIYNVHIMNAKEKEDAMTLEILQTIEENQEVTQRHLADNLGVALGLANSYLKRCANKGLIKIQHIPANRYLYYLTPKGFAEKSRLTAQYLSYSFDFYRKASQSVNETFNICHQLGHKKILFCGVSELAEIASVRLHEHELIHTATFDQQTKKNNYLGKPICRTINNSQHFDACLITALDQAEDIYKKISLEVNQENVFIPSFLGLNI